MLARVCCLYLIGSQFIAVLKLLVENTHVAMEDVMSIDISSIMLTLALFVSRFNGHASFRAKTKFCVMCESVCNRTDTLTLRKDSSARHGILDIIIEWIKTTTVRVLLSFPFSLMLRPLPF